MAARYSNPQLADQSRVGSPCFHQVAIVNIADEDRLGDEGVVDPPRDGALFFALGVVLLGLEGKRE